MRAGRIWPFRHFGLKLASVGLATLLWMVVAGEETVERGLRVPLEFQQIPEGLELQGEPLTLVDVRVRGSSGALSRMSAADVVAVLDLRSARPGYRLFQLTPEQVRVPFGVEVLQVNPPTVASRWCSRTRHRGRFLSCPASTAARLRDSSSARSRALLRAWKSPARRASSSASPKP
jgi:hypothetical protein